MTPWPRHALAVVLLAALNLGLYGRLYSPLDHAYPDGEARSASVTRFITENPDPWGWNPTWGGGAPTQMTALPAFHYAAALISRLGIVPLYAHRILAVTMALLAPIALYFLLSTFGMSWLVGLAGGVVLSLVSLFRFFPLPSFLPSRLAFLERTGDAPFIAALTLMLVAIALTWRAALDRRPYSLFLAAIAMALVALTEGEATLIGLLALLMLEVAMLGIAGEYRFSHRRVFLAVIWAYLLSCFWLTFSAAPWLMNWFRPVVLPRILIGAIVIRLLFLGRRNPLACWIALCLWTFGYLSYLNGGRRVELVAELFLLLAILVCLAKCVEEQRIGYRIAGLFLLLVLMFVRLDVREIYWRFPAPAEGSNQRAEFYIVTPSRLKQQVGDWRGDWGMKRPSESAEFKVTRWLVENPPRGRIAMSGFSSLGERLNAWVSYPQKDFPGTMTQEHVFVGGNYSISESDQAPVVNLPVLYKAGKYVVRRVPFESLAVSVNGAQEGTPLNFEWFDASHARVTGTLPPKHSIRLNVSFKAEPAWYARQRGQSLPIQPGDHNTMLLSPPAGPIDIDLLYEGTREQHIFGYVSAFVWVASIGYVVFRSRRG